ncbi:MAG: hypothetical protein F6K39_32810 [Okeania sp. SIO3B3]|nr:hypothetical protein [Okeania sp. SIO3B3]
MFNIIKNGAQAMHKAGVEKPRFTFRTVYESRRGMVRLDMQNNGPDMPADVRKRVFEPFFTTKSVGEGTGLGLSVSYFIIRENHGGEMEVESGRGDGVRFIIRLPVEE